MKRSRAIGTGVFIAALVTMVIAAWFGRGKVREFDAAYLDHQLVDLYVRLRTGEEWSAATPLPQALDYQWVDASGGNFVEIAHALGNWGRAGENSLAALSASRTAGVRLMEVDLSLGQDGVLYCFHGPGIPPPVADGSIRCDLDRLLVEAVRMDFFLVLDLKSDFVTSARIIAGKVQDRDLGRRVVFQLYGPADVREFNAINGDGRFAGPIVTLYRSQRSVHYMRETLRRLNVHVLTVPMERVEEFAGPELASLVRLAHPVTRCEDWRLLRSRGFSGGYVSFRANC